MAEISVVKRGECCEIKQEDDRIPTSEIGRMVLDRLKAESSAAAESFEKYTKIAYSSEVDI